MFPPATESQRHHPNHYEEKYQQNQMHFHLPTPIGRTTNSPPVAKLGGACHREFSTKPIPLGHVLYLRLFQFTQQRNRAGRIVTGPL